MHSDFRLNGVSYDRDRLLSYAHELCNEKQEYLSELGRFILDWYSEKPDKTLHTSGSTGKPTQILAPKTMLSASAMTTVKGIQSATEAASSFVFACSAYRRKDDAHSSFIGWIMDRCYRTNCNVLKVSKTYDFTAMTPHQLRNSIDHIDQFKQIIVGGAPVDDSLRAALKGHASRILFNLWNDRNL